MTKAQATRRGKELVRKMKGKGWKLRVWENLGWHCEVHNSPLTVYLSEGDWSYWCLMNDSPEKSGMGSMLWPLDKKFSENPNLIVKRQVIEARKKINIILAAVERAEEIAGLKKEGK